MKRSALFIAAALVLFILGYVSFYFLFRETLQAIGIRVLVHTHPEMMVSKTLVFALACGLSTIQLFFSPKVKSVDLIKRQFLVLLGGFVVVLMYVGARTLFVDRGTDVERSSPFAASSFYPERAFLMGVLAVNLTLILKSRMTRKGRI